MDLPALATAFFAMPIAFASEPDFFLPIIDISILRLESYIKLEPFKPIKLDAAITSLDVERRARCGNVGQLAVTQRFADNHFAATTHW